MNPITATVDTQISSYSSIGTINVLDDVTIDLTILTNGIINAPWVEPEFQLIGVKADKNEVRQLDGFNVTSLENRTLAIKLKNEMLTYPGMLKLQLITKDSGRTSTTVFYLYVGQSLEHDIVSHRDVKVLDDLEVYVEKANHNLEVYEQRMDIRDEQFNNLNELMNQAESKREQAELNRQQIFDVNEASRTRTFNNQMNNQETSFNDVQIERANEFERDQTKRADDFVQAQNNHEQAFNESQSANQSTFNSNEKKRQDEFNANQVANQKIFNDSESARARTFEVAESERCENEKTRKEDESKRVSDEVKRVEAENKRQQKMQEFEDIANQIASDLQEQVARVDEFVTANELKLLEEDARIDYMGNQQNSIRKVNEANVDYAVKTAIGEFNYLDYEGQHITATNSIEGHTKSAILKGQTLVNSRGNTVSSGGWSTTDSIEYIVEGANSFLNFECTLLPNTKYLTFFEFEGRGASIQFGTRPANGVWDSAHVVTTDGICKTVVTTGSDSKWLSFIVPNSSSVTDYVKISRIMIIPYQEGMENWDIPYFEGMQSVRMPVLTTTGKNLFDMNRPYDAITDSQATVVQDTNQITVSSADSGTYVSANFILDKDFFAGKTVTGSCLYESDIKDIGTVQITYQDGNGDHHYQWIKTPKTFTFPNNFIGDVMLCVCANNTGTPQSNTVTVKNIQLELGSTATPYEHHRSNILSTPSDLELRGIDDVRDELNLLTGELTQRFEEIVLDGSESWSQGGTQSDGFIRFYAPPTIKKAKHSKVISSNLPYYNGTVNYGIVGTENVTGNSANYHLNVNIKTERIGVTDLTKSEQNIELFKVWLSNNPITVQYELETESIKTVVLNDNTVYSYDGVTHYSCSSEEGSLVPTVSLKVPTDVQATITQQRNTIQALESENEALKYGLIEANQYREDGDMDLLSNQWDIDFRLFEIEMVLDVPMMATFKLKETDIMSRFLQAKTLILGGRYERSKMEYQLKRYLEAGQLTQEEYDELISLMDAREMLE